MSEETPDVVVIGSGILNWVPGERITDRYGTVHLNQDNNTSVMIDPGLIGSQGRLVAVIEQAFPSRHIGDLVRGLHPTSPVTIGNEYELGVGTLFVEDAGYGAVEVGVKPDDGRATGWLNPQALYQCHDQRVRLELRKET